MASAAPAKPFARPYKDFLTPFLHRNFVTAALLTLAVCYLEAVWIGGAGDLWSWIPFGLAGVRTVLLFISALAVFILRVANMHVGLRAARSELDSFLHYSLSAATVHTVLWYGFSAWFFSEVYIWSQPTTANLSTVDPGKSYERPRLNERPIFLRTLFFFSGLIQAAVHLYFDADRLALPSDKTTSQLSPPLTRIRARLSNTLNFTMKRTLVETVVLTLMYIVFLRHPAWHWTYAIARNLFSLPRHTRPASIPAYIGDLAGRFLIESFLLHLLWDFVNLAFTEYVSQPPMKLDQPLSSGSKDPNGSLIAGLKAKKEIPRSFAFWELFLIAQDNAQRREAIFRDIDRADGSAWSQIVTVCLGEVHAVVKRIQDFQSPPSKSPPPQAQDAIHRLPKLTAPLKSDEKIFTAAPKPRGAYEIATSDFGKFAKSHGQSPESLSPRARKLLDAGADILLTKSQQQQLSPGVLSEVTQKQATQWLKVSFGIPFRQLFSRCVNSVVLGQAGNVSTIVDSVLLLSKLAVCSLKEDQYGKVAMDVPNIIRTYTSTVEKLVTFIKTQPPHWTDVNFKDLSRTSVEEVNVILGALQASLGILIDTFEPFAENLHLSLAELRKAKEASRASL